MRGTVEAGKPHDIVRTQPTNLISMPPHTHPPPSCGRPTASSSRTPNPLHMGYNHPAHTPDAFRTGYDNPTCIPDTLRMGYNNPAHTPNSPSCKAVHRETTRPPFPPPIAYAGCTTPAPRLTHPHLLPHMPLWAYAVGAGEVGGGARKGGTWNKGQCNPSGEWPGVAPSAPCPRMHAKVGGRRGRVGWGRVGRNPEKGHTRTEGCAHKGGAPPRSCKGGRMCEQGMTQPG
ncbi:hypothetical protein BJY52DRAFT_1228313 [Lactarius psammicola]|nr:hypothetical protein BJY52DRAFT_1228313 [Lactarius psammicola]